MKENALAESAMSIAAVERDTGIAKDSLRVWERRYGFPAPLRDNNDERLYPAEQVSKLRLIRRLLDLGLRPSKVVNANLEELNTLVEQHAPSRSTEGQQHTENAVLQLIQLHRTQELLASLQQSLMKQGLQRFVAETLTPLNKAVGLAWARGQLGIAEEHLYTEQVQNILRSAISNQVGHSKRPKILLTTFPDEHHVLGLLMVEATLVPEGAACISLGARTPLSDIRTAVASGGFDIVGLSFSIAYPLRQAVKDLLELRAALPEAIAIWAGGMAVSKAQAQLPGVQVIRDINETLLALRGWHSQHQTSSP